jgi:hypothetical protein
MTPSYLPSVMLQLSCYENVSFLVLLYCNMRSTGMKTMRDAKIHAKQESSNNLKTEPANIKPANGTASPPDLIWIVYVSACHQRCSHE